ncbi:MAG: SH3 domain-containing protein [Pseudomonadota bacterium]
MNKPLTLGKCPWWLAALLLILLGMTACATPPPPPLRFPPPLGPGAPAPPPPVSGAMLYVAVPSLNLRACPATNCQILRVLSRGTPLLVLAEQGGWVQVQANGLSGWVGGRYVSPHPMAGTRRPQQAGPAGGPPAPNEEWADTPAQTPAETPADTPAPTQDPAVQEEFAAPPAR